MAALPPLYLLDTNVLVHLVRRDAVWARIRDRYQPLIAEPTPISSVVTVGELRSLALQFGWGAEKVGQMEYCLGYFRRVSIDDPDVVRAYSVIDAASQMEGHPLGKNDAWIAATAAVTGARLLTTDKDFDRLDGRFLSRDWIDPELESK